MFQRGNRAKIVQAALLTVTEMTRMSVPENLDETVLDDDHLKEVIGRHAKCGIILVQRSILRSLQLTRVRRWSHAKNRPPLVELKDSGIPSKSNSPKNRAVRAQSARTVISKQELLKLVGGK